MEMLWQSLCYGEALTDLTVNDGFLSDGTYIYWDSDTLPECPWERVTSGSFELLETDTNDTVVIFPDIGVSVFLLGTVELCNVIANATNNEYLYVIQSELASSVKLRPLTYVSWTSMILTATQFVDTNVHMMYDNLTQSININNCILENTIRRDILVWC